jgi:hypothetical protein
MWSTDQSGHPKVEKLNFGAFFAGNMPVKSTAPMASIPPELLINDRLVKFFILPVCAPGHFKYKNFIKQIIRRKYEEGRLFFRRIQNEKKLFGQKLN